MLILIHGLKRSGNHAIMHWLQAHGEFEVFNNCIPIAPILRGERALPAPVSFKLWYTQQRSRQQPRDAGNKIQHQTPSIITSLEDHDIHTCPFHTDSDPLLPTPFINVLILRDPTNLFASRIRKASRINHPAYPRQPGAAMEQIRNLWKQHATEFLGHSNILKNRIGIYFNTWFTDPEYRQRISQQLQLPFTDNGFAHISAIGGGSSFSGTRHSGDNQKLAVLHRRQALNEAERNHLETILADSELQGLSDKIDRIHNQ